MNRRHQVRVKPWMVLVGGFSLMKLMGAFVPPPQGKAVPVRCTPHLGARLVGHVVGSCIMVAPAYASDTSGLDFQQFVEEFAGKKDFFAALASATLSVAGTVVAMAGTAVAVAQLDQAKRSADEAKRSADEAFKASPEGKIQQALAKAMEPFEPSRPQDEVIQRPVMEALRQRIASWQQHATIIGGRYQSGKSVATEEALRGARGVVRCTIRSADWADRMCKQLGVDDEGLFKEVMRRAREKLKDFPDNLTKFPILLLEVPRTTTEGINLISSTAKDVATDKIGSVIHVIVSASSAAVALAFDAGGTERQEDIWVGDLTEEEAKEFLALHGHENKWEDFVDACGFRIGDLAKACENLKKGLSLDDTKQECQRVADDEVRGFMELQVHPTVTGCKMAQELLTAYPAGILNVVNGIRILPREVAALIRNKSCHAVYFHPIKKRFFFASKLHKEAAEAQLANP
ncbi:unnamed protein product [Effrenium voratum]|uniref:Uncharacterized protein n=2 Tax=Effrenium voratum TaxID=2562239 RepID=A0AA36IB62_9DINO|nr:unnamed protein product [Effrenium voratum]